MQGCILSLTNQLLQLVIQLAQRATGSVLSNAQAALRHWFLPMASA